MEFPTDQISIYIVTGVIIVITLFFLLSKKSVAIALDSEKWIPFKLIKIETISHG